MAKYFGTDGIRGRYGIELNNSIAFKLGQSLKSVLGTERLVIGMDTRESGSELLYSVASGAQSMKIDVMIAGVVSTPLISHYSKEKGITGVMITASHNPYTDNGLKVFNKGNKLLESEELAIEKHIDDKEKFNITNIGKTYSGEEVLDLYADLIESLDLEEIDLKVGYDSANGANYLIAKGIIEELCIESYQIGNTPDGKNINLNCGSTHLESIKELVIEKKLDIGLSFDGDGDRILVIDQDGDEIDGDLLIYILATYLKENNRLNKDTVVLTQMSNLGVIKAFEKQGINVVLTGVGDKYVLEELNNNDYSIGGENSGHIILKEFLNTGDGLLVGIYLLKILKEKGLTLKELTKDVKMWPQQMVNIRTYKKEALEDERVLKVIQEVKNILKDDGKVLVRASGTEPLLRVTLSCELQEDLDKYMDMIVSTIKKAAEEK
jgi:phosphoglucosamine mutase